MLKTNFLKITALFFLSAILFTSCSDDDDAPNSPGSGVTDASIIGTWRMVEMNYTGTSSSDTMGQSLSADFDGTALNIDYIITFTENPNEYEAVGSYDIDLNATILGQNTQQTQSLNDINQTGTFDKNGDVLTLSGSLNQINTSVSIPEDSFENQDAEIQELTDTTLILVSNVEQTVEDSGFTSTSTLYSYSRYVRE